MDPQTSAPAHAGLRPNPPGSAASLTCGILSIVLAWLPIAGLVLGIIAVVMAAKAKKIALGAPEQWNPGGTRVAGFVCGVIGIVFGGITLISWAVTGALIFGTEEGREAWREAQEEWQQRGYGR